MTTRRVALACGCAAVLAGCKAYGPGQPAPAPTGPPVVRDLGPVSDIPVGGGKVFPDQNVVVTQPTNGVIKAFSARCTHQGCTVDNVSNGTINCPCHGSQYKIDTGSVAGGPAPRALPPANVTVVDGIIKLG